MLSDLIPPERNADDSAHLVIRQGLNLIPLAGGNLADLFTFLVAPPIEKRLDKWRNAVAITLLDLKRDCENLEHAMRDLQSDDRFVSTLIEASRIAVTTHAAEKLEALRNAVCNVAVGITVEEYERQMFLRFVDELTELHLHSLKCLSESRVSGVFGSPGTAPMRIRNDLESRDLIKRVDSPSLISTNKNGIAGVSTVTPADQSWNSDLLAMSELTEFGWSFLRFIKTPERPEAAQHD